MVRSFKNLYHLGLAILAVIYYRFPAKNLKVIGVTGTDGKTTTVNLIYHILRSAGFKVAMISSVNAKINDQEFDTGFHITTPDSFGVQKYLRLATEKGCEYAVVEATSHGLDQYRLFGCNFLIGVITNVTHEHLDYHKTLDNYRKAKAKLFAKVKWAILNRDDSSYSYLVSHISCHKPTIVTYGLKNKADFMPQTLLFKTQLPGEYNQYNCLAAIAATSVLGIDSKTIQQAITSFSCLAGRMEIVPTRKEFKIIVDFAHTPNALEQALKAARKMTKNKLIAVFGCAGLRDYQKRPKMGEIAGQLADYVVITAEDPRIEDVDKIIEKIAQGCLKNGAGESDPTITQKPPANHVFFKIPDRQEAINFAIQKLARKDDVVIICGKGHEKSMCFGTREYPWSDQEAVKRAVNG